MEMRTKKICTQLSKFKRNFKEDVYEGKGNWCYNRAL